MSTTSLNLDLKYISLGDVRLAYFESDPSNSNNGVILCVHGLACHARCWDSMLKLLENPGRVIAIELRGHGRSENKRPYGWKQFGKDLLKFIEVLDLKSIVAVGHSMGGHAILQVAGQIPERFSSLLLLEPVVFEPIVYERVKSLNIFDSPEEHPIARRRNHWDSPEEWMQVVRGKMPFKLWDPEVLWDHCRFGLTPTDAGAFELSCPPLVEAEAAMNRADTNIHPYLTNIHVPATVIRGKIAHGLRHPMDNIHSCTWPNLAHSLLHGQDQHFPDLTHFIPMESPTLVARQLQKLIHH